MRDDIAVGFVRNALHRAEVRHVHVLRDDNQSAGMFPHTALYSDTSEDQTLRFFRADRQISLFQIALHISISIPIPKRADDAGVKDVICSEHLLRLPVRLLLILCGKIEVNIRHSFLAGIPHKGLKRNIKAVLLISCTADWANSVRQIHSAPGVCGIAEIRMAAARAAVMGRQRIYLCNAVQECDEG